MKEIKHSDLHLKADKKITHRRVWALSWPLFIANLSAPLIALSDTFVLGHLHDSIYLAAAAIAGQVFSFSILVFAFLTTSTTSIISSTIGAHQHQDTPLWALRSLILAFFAAVGMTIFMPLVLNTWLMFVGARGGTLKVAHDYSFYMLFALFPAIMTQSLQGILLGYQRSREVMTISLAMNICNISLNILLAWIMDFRVTGVAFATLTSHWLGFFIAVRGVRQVIKFNQTAREILPRLLNTSELIRLISMNKDLLIRSICIMGYLQFIIKMSAELGQTIVAVNSILVMFFLTSSRIQDAVATTIQMLISRLWHTDNIQEIKECYLLLMRWVTGMSIALAFLFLLFGTPLTQFLTSIQDVQNMVIDKIWLVAAYVLIVSWTYFYNCILLGASEMTRLRNSYLISITVCLLTSILFYYPSPSVSRLWICVFIFEITRLLLLKFNFHQALTALHDRSLRLTRPSSQTTDIGVTS